MLPAIMSPDEDLGALLEPDQAEAVEQRDRERPIPGGEPDCPVCGERMIRRVERHPAPRSDDSPFRVRLVCGAENCRRWTVYDW